MFYDDETTTRPWLNDDERGSVQRRKSKQPVSTPLPPPPPTKRDSIIQGVLALFSVLIAMVGLGAMGIKHEVILPILIMLSMSVVFLIIATIVE